MISLEYKKKLGAFYTPRNVTDALSAWAIRATNEKVLEPSFGGCNFLTSVINRLAVLGADHPGENVFGYDIDPNAFTYLSERGISNTNFTEADFLDFPIDDHEHNFQVVIGNPPYLPIHKLDTIYKKHLYKSYKKSDFKIPRRSSIWVYFIIRSLEYLAAGGRMAWIVPDSITFTDYGKKLITYLSAHFATIKLISIQERYFNDVGTEEKTAILACEGFNNGTCEASVTQTETLESALALLFEDQLPVHENYVPVIRLKDGFKKQMLKDIFAIRIGIVIGATKLLTFSADKTEENPYYPDYCYPVITKGRKLGNLKINKEMLLQEKQLPIFLVDGIKIEHENPTLFTHLIEHIPSSVLLNDTFSNRQKLFGYDDFKYPDGFLTFYSQKLPKLVLNEGKELNCTNSVHRLYLLPAFEGQTWLVKFITLQFFAGIFHEETLSKARQYGNKIKKYEPSDAGQIPVITPDQTDPNLITRVESLFDTVVELISSNKTDEAMQSALSFFVSDIIDIQDEQLSVA